MNADAQTGHTDWYVLAQFALWAGDTKYAQHCLRTFGPTLSTSHGLAQDETLHSYLSFFAVDAMERIESDFEKQLGDELTGQDWNEPFKGSPLDADHIPDEPVIASERLRGVVHAMSDREFELRGFVTDLQWGSHLLGHAERVAESHTKDERRRRVVQGIEDEFPLPTRSWAMGGDFFRLVTVDALCLITAKGTWTAAQLPDDAGPIFRGFKEIFRELELKEAEQSK